MVEDLPCLLASWPFAAPYNIAGPFKDQEHTRSTWFRLLGVTHFDKSNSQGTTSLFPLGDLDDHLAIHRDNAECSSSPLWLPKPIEYADHNYSKTCIDPIRFSASDVLKQLDISDHRRGPQYLQGTSSLATGSLESNPSGMHLHTFDSSTPLCRSSEVPRETKVEYRVSVLHLKTVKLDDQLL